MKTMNNESRTNKAIKMINQFGATWEEVGEVLGLTPATVQKLCREHYKQPKRYNNLLAKARANKKAKQEAKEVIVDTEEIKEVIVVETGYLMKAGVPECDLDIYIPHFCIRELEKLSNTHKVASDILARYWGTRDITSLKLKEETLYEEPKSIVKDRTIGIVAVCDELDSLGYRVRLYTNSREVEELATLQGCDIIVTKISNK